MLIEVSDIYDAFFQIARSIWIHGQFHDIPEWAQKKFGPSSTELVDELEFDFFFAACSRRAAIYNHNVRPSQVRRNLKLHDINGVRIDGPRGEYHSHTFDWGRPTDNDINNCVAAGDLTPLFRTETRIFLDAPGPSRE